MSVPVPTPDVTRSHWQDIVPNARHLSASQVVRRLFRMVILFASARLLGAEAFGNYVVLLTVVEMVSLISGYGYMDFLTREVASHPVVGRRLAVRITCLRLLFVIPALGLATLLLALFQFPHMIVVDTVLLALTLPPRAAGESAQGVMKGLRYFAPLPWIELLQGSIVLGGVTTLLALGWGIRGVIVAEIVGAAAGAVVAVWSVSRHLPPAGGSAPGLRGLIRSTFAFNLYPFIVNVYDRVDVILLARLKNTFVAGIYSLPYRAFAMLQIIPYGLMGALLPVFSSSRDKDQVREACSTMMRFLLLTSMLVVLVTLSFASPVILFLLGPGYADSVPTIKILVWASVPAFLNFALNTLFLSASKERIFLKTASLCGVFNVVANLILIPRFSFIGAAVVTVLTECLLLAQNLYFIRATLGRSVFPKDGARITAIFALVLAGFWGLQQVIPRVLAGGLACAVFALGSAWTTRGIWHAQSQAGSTPAISTGSGSISS